MTLSAHCYHLFRRSKYFTQPVLSLGAHCYYSFELGVSLRTYRLKYTACRPVFLADGSHRSPSSADSLSLSSWRRLHPLRLVHGPRGGRHRWPGTPGPLQDVAHLQRSPPHERKRKMTGSWWTTTRRRLDTVIGGTRGQTRSRGLRHRKLRPILLRELVLSLVRRRSLMSPRKKGTPPVTRRTRLA